MANRSKNNRLIQLTHTSIDLLFNDGPVALLMRLYLWLRGERRSFRPAALSGSTPRQSILLYCDSPDFAEKAVLSGTTTLRGWALARDGIDKIQVYLNGSLIGLAKYGQVRPDIASTYTTAVNADRSGFSFRWDTTTTPDGPHELRLKAFTLSRQTQTLTGKVVIDNTAPVQTEYEAWIETYETHDVLEAQTLVDQLATKPLLSIIMPVYDTPLDLLKQAITSVQDQTYQNWELCICDDGSTAARVWSTLQQIQTQDARIKITRLTENQGISAASNAALALASGSFIVLMDHDDVLSLHALYFVAKHLNNCPQADLIYSDEDKIDMDGRRSEPFFKPDWSPDLFLSMNYLNHLTVIRTELLQAVGGFREGYEGSQDYDLYLRLIERTQQIYHIPKILYHWRTAPTSVAAHSESKQYAQNAAQRALTEYLQRQKLKASIHPAHAPGRWRIKYRLMTFPKVTVIIPCHTNVEGLRLLADRLAEQTTHRSFELIVIDNSTGNNVAQTVGKIAQIQPETRYLDCRNQPFNFSQMNNAAVRLTDAPFLLFLNDDVEPINPEWLEAMVEHIQRPEVGVVGAKLIYPDRTLQHAGVTMGLFNNCGHAFKLLPADEREPVYFDLPHVVRNCSAVTGACLLTRRDLFQQVHGFNEIHLPAAFQDIDYCLKVGQQGYRVVYTPHAQLFHYESKTKYQANRETFPHPYEIWYMQQTWAEVIAQDPYYNPNLTRYAEDYSLRPVVRRYGW